MRPGPLVPRGGPDTPATLRPSRPRPRGEGGARRGADAPARHSVRLAPLRHDLRVIDWCGALRRAATGPSVTYGVIGVCALVFALGPASGLTAPRDAGDALLAAQSAYFRRWG